MTSLEKLVLHSYDLSRDDRLGDILSKLRRLKMLDVGFCDLSQLPEW